MELGKLEKRRDEIIGFNNQIINELNKIDEARKKLINQYQVNIGALSEVNQWIEKNEDEIKTEEITDNVVDIKDKKSKK
jgi:translation initiation factor IF-2